tara:strand:- start:2394 stop:2633 length:240 start_codon:yes stop_codon:yes gene_type:complete
MLILNVTAYTQLVTVMAQRNDTFRNCIADDSVDCLFILPTGDKVYFTHCDAEFFIPANYGTTDTTKQWLDQHSITYWEQ